MQWHTAPACVADERSADFVGNTFQGHDLFLYWHLQQVVIAEFEWMFDVAAHREPPFVFVKVRAREVFGDLVEVMVRGDKGRQIAAGRANRLHIRTVEPAGNRFGQRNGGHHNSGREEKTPAGKSTGSGAATVFRPLRFAGIG